MNGRIAGRITAPGNQVGKPEEVGDVLLGMLDDPQLTDEARCAIRAGITGEAHADCPCMACHEAAGTIPETWLPVEGWPYEVSSRGGVRRIGGKRLSPPREKNAGYEYAYVNLRDRVRVRRVRVHVLVAEAFHGPRPSPEHQASHLNKDPTNNRASNLAWLPRKTHLYHDGRYGVTHHNAKLDAERVLEIRRRADSGEPYSAIAREIGVNSGTVWQVAKRVTWAHVPESRSYGTI